MPSPAQTAHPEGIAGSTTAPRPGGQAARFWPQGWWRLVDIQIGIIPLPVYLILVGLLWVLTAEGEIKADAPTMIAVLVLGGFTCAEIGKRLPVLRQIGAGAIFATFIPSALVYYALIRGRSSRRSRISPNSPTSSISTSRRSSSAASWAWTGRC